MLRFDRHNFKRPSTLRVTVDNYSCFLIITVVRKLLRRFRISVQLTIRVEVSAIPSLHLKNIRFIEYFEKISKI